MGNRRYTPKHTGKVKSGTSRTARSSRSVQKSGGRSSYSKRDSDLFEDTPSYHRDQQKNSARGSGSGKRKKTGCALASLYFIIIFGISICLSLFAIFAANDVMALVKTDSDIAVVIAEDSTIGGVSKVLDKSGIVNYGVLFRIFNTLIGDADIIVSSGSYTLNPTMDYGQIVRALTKTTSTTAVKVTIPEGYTMDQIRQTLLENNVTSEKLLDNALNEYPYKHEFLKGLQPGSNHWLEGYLFPDTYEFLRDSKQPVYEVVNIMLNNFNSKYDEAIQEGANELGLSTEEVVIIASLIEREAKAKDEFAKISGVIHNRLRNSTDFPYLQIDASLQYAVGHNNKLTNEDKKLDSPYNLYLYKGLPPGPICNPGYDALYAATHPDDHDYYYYVAMPDGTHLFAQTNSQHNRNRERADEAWANAS